MWPDILHPIAVERSWAELTLLRRRAYRWGLLPSHRLAVPVVGVGALSLGGAGKTPVAARVAEILVQTGQRVGLCCSGYGGTMGPRASIVHREAVGHRVGDEPAMLARRGFLVARGRDKLAASRILLEHGVDVVVVDDALGHLRLERDLEIALATPSNVGHRLVGGAGCLLSWHHIRDGTAPTQRPQTDVVSQLCPSAVFDHQGRCLGGPGLLAGQRVYLVAAIARPGAFERMVQGLGAMIVGRRFLPDHAHIRAEDFRPPIPADLVLTTEKDWARLDPLPAGTHVLHCEVSILAGQHALMRTLGDLPCFRS